MADAEITLDASSSLPTVVIHRDAILPASETFVLSQAAALREFRPFFVGARTVPGLAPPAEQTYIADRGTAAGRGAAKALRLGYVLPRRVRRRIAASDLIHAHFGPDAITGMRLARRYRLPLVVTYHGYDVTMTDEFLSTQGGLARRYINERRRLFMQADRHIAVSDFIARRLEAKGCPRERILRHYIGVDTAAFRYQGLRDRQPLVLFVGRLVEQKGPGVLLEAIHRLQAEGIQVGADFVGEGPLRPELERFASQTLSGVTFHGVRPVVDVRALMHQARVLCVPAVTPATGQAEALGIVFAESQASGLPPVSSCSGGIPEVVKDRVTGLLAGERDVAAVARHLRELLTDDDMWRAYSRAGRAWIETSFDLQAQTGALEQTYGEVVKRHRERMAGGEARPRKITAASPGQKDGSAR